jgi:hypothetical protein
MVGCSPAPEPLLAMATDASGRPVLVVDLCPGSGVLALDIIDDRDEITPESAWYFSSVTLDRRPRAYSVHFTLDDPESLERGEVWVYDARKEMERSMPEAEFRRRAHRSCQETFRG